AELLKQLGRNRRQSRRLGFRFARHKFSLGACYALNTKFLTGPELPNQIRHRHAQLSLLERGHDLLHRILLALHRQPPVPIGKIASETLTLICVQDF
ncbi:hypothetical protein, partial [Burkholderia cenocepacia]|uniref:hypothetical protein n=1 Tax=Burkholderia cenocepacia TaxID=95486 RepID=UPI002237855D